MQIIDNINEIDRAKWRKLLVESPYASPFQTPDFYNIYDSSENCDADVFVVDDNGVYQALLLVTVQHELGLKAYFSRRAIVYGGLLCLPDVNASFLSRLMLHITSFYQGKIIYLEVRNNFNYKAYIPSFSKANFAYVPWLNIKFDNENGVLVRQLMSKSRQRQLNKALRNGAKWRVASCNEDLKAFYVILSHLYRTKVKKPLPTLSFFLELNNSAIAQCLVVEYKGVIIGGAMLLFDSHSVYEFYICGLDKWCNEAQPSVMAMWAMVEYAKQNQITQIDLMGAGQPDIPNSVRDFKLKFGGDLVEYGRFLYVFNPFLYKLGSLYLSLKQKISSF